MNKKNPMHKTSLGGIQIKIMGDFYEEFEKVIDDKGILKTHYLDVLDWFLDQVKIVYKSKKIK